MYCGVFGMVLYVVVFGRDLQTKVHQSDDLSKSLMFSHMKVSAGADLFDYVISSHLKSAGVPRSTIHAHRVS
jgi:hypothetical protein